MPSPDPGTVFIPLLVEDRPRMPRARFFSAHLIAPFQSEWAAGWYVRRLYSRDDLWSAVWSNVAEPSIEAVDESRIRVLDGMAQPWPVGDQPRPEIGCDRDGFLRDQPPRRGADRDAPECHGARRSSRRDCSQADRRVRRVGCDPHEAARAAKPKADQHD